jgi:hypothetical protein
VKAITLCAMTTLVVLGLSAPVRSQVSDDGGGTQAAVQPASTARLWAGAREPGRPGSFELTASLLWVAPSSLGTNNASLTSNDTAGTAYRLFSATGDFQSTGGFEARGSYHVTRMFAVEGGVTYSRPDISFTIASDADGAAGFTASGETISQFFVDASLVAYPSRHGFAGGRARPFIEVGAGYLRELHGQSSAASGYFSLESGQVYHAGAGMKYFFRPRPAGIVKAYGLRFDVRYYVRNGGFTFGGSHPKTCVAGGGLVVAF